MFHSVSLLSQAALACGSRALPSVLFLIKLGVEMGVAMGGVLKCIVRLCDHVWGEFTLHGVITKQFFLICPCEFFEIDIQELRNGRLSSLSGRSSGRSSL